MRNSNIELLRIVSMVLIVMFHFSVHGCMAGRSAALLRYGRGNAELRGQARRELLHAHHGVFHGARASEGAIAAARGAQTWFYSFAILAIFAIAQPDLVTSDRLRKAVTPITSGEHWFITCYLALIVTSPFLNVLYRHLTDDGRRRLAIIGFVVLSAIPTITTYNPIGSDLVWFFYLYLVGGWLRDRP